MKTRSTILGLAALATLSLSALAPTQALAWGHGWGHHYGHGWGHHYGYGHRWGYYGHRFYRWSGYRSYGSYGGYGYSQPSYGSYEAPAPIIKRVYVPVEVPVEVPVPVRVPVREQGCGCETSYTPPPPPVEECNRCDGPAYAPSRPMMRESFAPRRRAQDSEDVAQTELEK